MARVVLLGTGKQSSVSIDIVLDCMALKGFPESVHIAEEIASDLIAVEDLTRTAYNNALEKVCPRSVRVLYLSKLACIQTFDEAMGPFKDIVPPGFRLPL